MGERAVVDYTKYKLKPEEEIREILENIPRIFVIWCRKCYKEFKEDYEPECDSLRRILADSGTEITGCEPLDFLCNNHLTEKFLRDLQGDEPVGVVSCGIGIQFVASICSKRRVFALADSVLQGSSGTVFTGHHGISLGVERCAACGQCYLRDTAGICPVVGCPKGLLNGPCGGADKNGMCEVDRTRPCVWVEIYKRLKKQGRSLSRSVEIRDHNIFKPDEKDRIKKLNRSERAEGFYGGVHPLGKKESTERRPVENFPTPEKIFVFLSQHTGLLAKPVVRVGEIVKVGQKLGESAGLISSPVHSGISGKVIAVEERIHPVSQTPQTAIVVENDGLDTTDPAVQPVSEWESFSNDRLLEILRDKGIVGLGGAMFPTSVKLCPPKPVDTLLINGCECEPYLNADNRLMIEYPEALLKGVHIAQKILCTRRVLFAIEDNKGEAIESIKNRCKSTYNDVEVTPVKTKYPQGAERMLIKTLLNREVPEGGLPFDVGVVVLNVSTLYSIYRAIYEGMPLFERVITVSGEGVIKPGNYAVKIGTPFYNILNACFDRETVGKLNGSYELKMGGPMMGIVQTSTESAVIKGTTGLLLLEKPIVEPSEESECIKCGRCVDVCPMELYPLYYSYYGKKGEWKKTADHKVKNCIECGSCQYICPSKIDLISFIKKAKKHAYNKG
jgi:Na+-translocating ferredoxin:NAD+ oxidoreductase subunit C